MPYTPPAYNAVNFGPLLPDYTPPAYNAVNFVPVSTVPTLTISGKTTVSIRSGSLFAMAGAGLLTPETAVRSPVIAGSSSVVFGTDLRALAWTSGTTFAPRMGGRLLVFGVSDTDLRGNVYRPPGVFSFDAAAAVTFDPKVLAQAQFTQKAASKFLPVRGYIKPIKLVANSTTTMTMRGEATSRSAIQGSSTTLFSPKGTYLYRSVLTVPSAATVLFSGNAFYKSVLVTNTGAAANFYGQKVRVASFSFPSSGSTGFVSSYTMTELPKTYFDVSVVYVKTSVQSVAVRT